jgi:hypothetical protein
MAKAQLAAREAEYAANCNDPEKPCPVPDPVPAPAPQPDRNKDLLDELEALTGLTGAALILYLIISEGSRLFPPRNLVLVP